MGDLDAGDGLIGVGVDLGHRVVMNAVAGHAGCQIDTDADRALLAGMEDLEGLHIGRSLRIWFREQ